MAYYVVIRGPLGVGKTIIAKKLAQTIRADYISIDSILAKYGLDKVIGKNIPIKNFLKANEKIIPNTKRKLERGKSVVFDGNFYHKRQINHLIRNLGPQCSVFTLKASLEVCIERDSKRKRKYGEKATAAVYGLVSRFDYGIIINTSNKTPSQVIKKIMTYLPNK